MQSAKLLARVDDLRNSKIPLNRAGGDLCPKLGKAFGARGKTRNWSYVMEPVKPAIPCPACEKPLIYDLMEDAYLDARGYVPYDIRCTDLHCPRYGFDLSDGTEREAVEQRDLHGYVRAILGVDGRLEVRAGK
jgi:hypothetical protein